MDPKVPVAETLRMYAEPSDRPSLDWAWAERRLKEAGTYWTTIHHGDDPHPRPVWGLWWAEAGALFLSIGSPVLSRRLEEGPRAATVHLDSGTEVVIVEGIARVAEGNEAVLAAYNAKYDWGYRYEEYGPFARLDPVTVVAWQAAGWAGRDGFTHTGRWRFA